MAVTKPGYMYITVDIDGEFKYRSSISQMDTIEAFQQQLETEMRQIFSHEMAISVLRLQDAERNDLIPSSRVGDVLKEGDKIFPIRNLVQFDSTGMVFPVILEVPRGPDVAPQSFGELAALMSETPAIKRQRVEQYETPHLGHQPVIVVPQEKSSVEVKDGRKVCTPYCKPLANFSSNHERCGVCGEMKPYKPTDSPYCTELCVTGDTRKLKSQGFDFCSICLARRRHMKYTKGREHQCIRCHRPWLILNEKGHCRTCNVKLSGKTMPGRKKGKAGDGSYSPTPMSQHDPGQSQAVYARQMAPPQMPSAGAGMQGPPAAVAGGGGGGGPGSVAGAGTVVSGGGVGGPGGPGGAGHAHMAGMPVPIQSHAIAASSIQRPHSFGQQSSMAPHASST